MLYLLAIILPWLALLFAGKPIQAVISLCLSVLSTLGLFLFLLPGLLLWLLTVAHAFAVIASARADERAKQIVDAIREQAPAPSSSVS